MTLFENPVALNRNAAELEGACFHFRARLLKGQFDPTGPFLGQPPLTRREDFREVREAALPEALKSAWLSWAFRFADARVNAPYHAAIAEAYSAERHVVAWDHAQTFTPRELFFGVLLERGKRRLYLDTLTSVPERLQSLTLELWPRRVELAHRAGFEQLDAIEAPAPNLESLAFELLTQTAGLYQEVVPQELEGLLEAAHAHTTLSPWPAQLNPRTLKRLLGNEEWLRGLDLRVLRLPLASSPASFCRGLCRVGAAIVDASAPKSQPFVLAHDPYGLQRLQFGALLGSLPQQLAFGRRRLQLSRTDAETQSRALAKSHLIHARTQALAVVLRARLCRSPKELLQDYEALAHQTYGIALPLALATVLPRLHPDSGQRFLACCAAPSRTRSLVAQFDEDWFDNPRGIEAVREEASQVPQTRLGTEQAQAVVSDYVQHVVNRLG